MPAVPGGKFEYPETGWSTGNMRMATRQKKGPSGKEFQELEGIRKEREDRLSQNMAYPQLSPEEWESWKKLPVKPGNVYAPKDQKNLKNLLQTNPDGFVVHKDNPSIKDIEIDADVFKLPDSEDFFVKPRVKPPEVAGGQSWETA